MDQSSVLCACGCGEPTRPGNRFVHHHSGRAGARGSPAERFWRKVDTTGPCWMWTAYRKPDGYGVFGAGRRATVLAHRFSWELVNGSIPAGLHILHRCDTPACVNPAHLRLGTHTDNMRDSVIKGRASQPRPRGSSCHQAKLTAEAVRDIRRLHAAGSVGYRTLAARYGVAWSAVRQAVKGLTWAHVE